MYYLKSRFYNPEFRRFMTPDSYKYLEPTNVGCINLYAYCNNNPMMYCDPYGKFIVGALALLLGTALAASLTPGGGFFLQMHVSSITYFALVIMSAFNTSIRNDMLSIGYNPFNTNKLHVYSSKVVSFYKGIPVFRVPTERSGTFLFIMLQNEFKDNYVLEHEYGHTIQQDILGPIKYLVGIAIPSPLSCPKGSAYYNQPWESSADYFGGVSKSPDHDMNDFYIYLGLLYFKLLFFL